MDTYPLHFHRRPTDLSALIRSSGFALGFTITLGVFVGINIFLVILPADRIAWGTRINGIAVGYQTKDEAKKLLSAQIPAPAPYSLSVVADEQIWTVSSEELGLHPDLENTLNQALAASHPQGWLELWSTRVATIMGDNNRTVPIIFDEKKVTDWIHSRAQEVDTPGRRAQAKLSGSSYVLDEGEAGQQLLQEDLRQTLLQRAAPNASISAYFEAVNTPLSPDGSIRAKKRLDVLRKKTIELVGQEGDRPQTLSAKEFFPWLILPDGFDEATIAGELAPILTRYERPAQNAQWELDESGKKLKTFVPHRRGRDVNNEELAFRVIHALTKLQTSEAPLSEKVELPFQESDPEITLEKLNNLGVKERIGIGTSTYHHSIPNRIYNVSLTSERLNHTLVPPGEEFSFNGSVGEVSSRTGYKTAYVIKDGTTQLGDGGGVCQVSTTLFRSVLNAGLPVTRWKAHSYRVSYYEQNSPPGYDATVYAPSTDFRFRNDTPGSIVVTTQADPQNQYLVIELWGTADGRIAQTSDYSISNQRPAPATVFIDDPTLPRGTRKQIDWSAPGATTRFTYTVKNSDGTERFSRQFVSNFQPWRAIFLVGTRD